MLGDTGSASSSATPRLRVIPGEGGSTTLRVGQTVRYVRLLVVFLAAIVALDAWRVLVRSAPSVTWSTILGDRPDLLLSASLAGAMLVVMTSADSRRTAAFVAIVGLGIDAALLAGRAAQGLALSAALQGTGTGLGFAALVALGTRAAGQQGEARVEALRRFASSALLPVLALFAIAAGHSLPTTGALRLDAAMHRWDSISGLLPSFAIARFFGMAPVLRGAGEAVCAAIPLVAAALIARQLQSRSRNQIDLLTVLAATGIVSIAVQLALRVDGPMAAYAGAWPWVEPGSPPRGDTPAGHWSPMAGLVPVAASWMIACFLEARTRSRYEKIAAYVVLAAAALAAVGLGRPWLASLVAPFLLAVACRALLSPVTSATARPRTIALSVGAVCAAGWTAAAALSRHDAGFSGWSVWLLALVAIGVSSWADARLARAVSTTATRSGRRTRSHLRIVKAS